MLYFPNGVMPGEVIDPDKLAQEFVKAANLADQTNQWSWNEGALNALTDLDGGDTVRTEQSFVSCSYGVALFVPPVLPFTAGYDVNLWQVPYKRGLLPIGDGTTHGRFQVTWTTEYPELVLCVMSAQYVRKNLTVDTSFDDGDPVARTQIRMQLDGQVLPGVGPFGHPIYNVRGIGLGAKAEAISNVWVGVVPAGTHVLMGVAGQGDNTAVDTEYAYDQTDTSSGVAIGTRHLFVVRFPRGDMMRG